MKRMVAGMVLPLLALLGGCSDDAPREPPATAGRTDTVASADGVTLEYDVYGEGPVALVFIHGWICDRTHWRYQIEPFAAAHTVVVLDLAGHGQSGSDRDVWSFDRFGADVQAVVEALELPRVILVGHSMGGPVALAAAARMPDRVLGVVGVDTLHDVERVVDLDEWEGLMERYEADFVGTCEGFVGSMLPEPTDDPGLPGWIRETVCNADPAVALAVGRARVRLDLPSMLAGAGVPVRCINSKTTAVTDVEANRRHGDYDASWIEEVGHFPMLERPDEFNRLLADSVEEFTGA